MPRTPIITAPKLGKSSRRKAKSTDIDSRRLILRAQRAFMDDPADKGWSTPSGLLLSRTCIMTSAVPQSPRRPPPAVAKRTRITAT